MTLCADIWRWKAKHSTIIYFHFNLKNAVLCNVSSCFTLDTVQKQTTGHCSVFHPQTTQLKAAEHPKAKLHDNVLFLKFKRKASDGWFAVCNAFHMQMSACSSAPSDQWCCRAVGGGHRRSSAVVCLVLVCVFVCETEAWERLGSAQRAFLSGCFTTKIKKNCLSA